jgi:hypothetical protein
VVSATVLHGVASSTSCRLTLDWNAFLIYLTSGVIRSVRGADKSLAQPGRKQATATEDFDVHISYYNHNWRNISTVYIYNKTSIKRNILTIKQNTLGSRSD